jgi:hypothetical protein
MAQIREDPPFDGMDNVAKGAQAHQVRGKSNRLVHAGAMGRQRVRKTEAAFREVLSESDNTSAMNYPSYVFADRTCAWRNSQLIAKAWNWTRKTAPIWTVWNGPLSYEAGEAEDFSVVQLGSVKRPVVHDHLRCLLQEGT